MSGPVNTKHNLVLPSTERVADNSHNDNVINERKTILTNEMKEEAEIKKGVRFEEQINSDNDINEYADEEEEDSNIPISLLNTELLHEGEQALKSTN